MRSLRRSGSKRWSDNALVRLTVLVPGPTDGTRRSVFGDIGELLLEPERRTIRSRTVVVCGPEPACLETGRALAAAGKVPVIAPELAGPDFGTWSGLSLEEVLERDAAGLSAWVGDPAAAPHGGESLAVHLRRVGAHLEEYPWPEAGAVLVASAFTARALCVRALNAGPASLLHLDVAPGATAVLTRQRDTWRVRSLS